MGLFDFLTGEQQQAQPQQQYMIEPPTFWESVGTKGAAVTAWRQAEAQAQLQHKQQLQYQALEEQYRPQGVLQGQPAEVKPGQVGVLPSSQSYPQEFFVRAAAIPGYQGLAQGAQQNAGAMARQHDQQIWDNTNMTAAQKATLSAQNEQRLWERDRWGQEFKANQQYRGATLGIQQQQLDLQKAQAGQAAQQAALAARFPALGLKGEDMVKYRSTLNNLDMAASTMTDVKDWLDRSDTGERTTSPVQRQQVATAVQTTMLPYLQQRFQAGAMQQGEQELFQKLAGDPAAVFGLTAKQRGVVDFWLNDIDQQRTFQYGLAGAQAPRVTKGSSALARSFGQQSAPQRDALVEWTP